VFVTRNPSAAVLGLAAVLAAVPARGQAPELSADPLLESLVREALAKNADVAAARDALTAARARPAQARALPDPMLSLAYTNDGVGPSLGRMPMSTLGLMWSQQLPWPGKRRLRSDIAEREAGEVEQQLARVRLGVGTSVRRAYYGLLQSRALLVLSREQGELWRQIEGVARARYAVGQGAQQDVLRVQVEVTRVGQLEAEQQAEERIRVAELNRLLGRAGREPLETAPALALRPAAEPLEAALVRLREISPELAASRLIVERARLAVALARKEWRPDLALQGGYMNRGGLDPMWQAGVGITLPLARKRRAEGVAEAEARLRAAERQVEVVDLQLRFRTEERLAQLAAAQRIAELYEKGIVPQDRMSVEAAVASYQAGRVPFVAVLEALATLYGDRSTLVRLLAGHARTQASLDEASLDAMTELPPMGAAAGIGAVGSARPPVSGMGSMGSR
jgi:cobalt-zinc-cadmium efflux system outer membrane protein